MNELAWLRSHVERCLQDEWQKFPLVVDPDGDYPFRSGVAACYVSIVRTGETFFIRVWAYAARSIRRTAKMLTEVNSINARTRTAHVYWAGGDIVVEQVMHADGVTRATLGQACLAVGSVADDIGTLFATVYAGSTPFPAEVTSAE